MALLLSLDLSWLYLMLGARLWLGARLLLGGEPCYCFLDLLRLSLWRITYICVLKREGVSLRSSYILSLMVCISLF